MGTLDQLKDVGSMNELHRQNKGFELGRQKQGFSETASLFDSQFLRSFSHQEMEAKQGSQLSRNPDSAASRGKKNAVM